MKNWILGLCLVGLSVVGAYAAVDSAIAGAITDATATFDSVKTALVAIGGFLIAYGLFKKFRRA